jgi:hypothetical protein
LNPLTFLCNMSFHGSPSKWLPFCAAGRVKIRKVYGESLNMAECALGCCAGALARRVCSWGLPVDSDRRHRRAVLSRHENGSQVGMKHRHALFPVHQVLRTLAPYMENRVPDTCTRARACVCVCVCVTVCV